MGNLSRRWSVSSALICLTLACAAALSAGADDQKKIALETPINQVANVTLQDARTIAVSRP